MSLYIDLLKRKPAAPDAATSELQRMIVKFNEMARELAVKAAILERAESDPAKKGALLSVEVTCGEARDRLVSCGCGWHDGDDERVEPRALRSDQRDPRSADQITAIKAAASVCRWGRARL